MAEKAGAGFVKVNVGGGQTMTVRKFGKKLYGLRNANRERVKNGLKPIGKMGKVLKSDRVSGGGGCSK